MLNPVYCGTFVLNLKWLALNMVWHVLCLFCSFCASFQQRLHKQLVLFVVMMAVYRFQIEIVNCTSLLSNDFLRVHLKFTNDFHCFHSFQWKFRMLKITCLPLEQFNKFGGCYSARCWSCLNAGRS